MNEDKMLKVSNVDSLDDLVLTKHLDNVEFCKNRLKDFGFHISEKNEEALQKFREYNGKLVKNVTSGYVPGGDARAMLLSFEKGQFELIHPDFLREDNIYSAFDKLENSVVAGNIFLMHSSFTTEYFIHLTSADQSEEFYITFKKVIYFEINQEK